MNTDDEQDAYDNFKELAKFIEEEKVHFARVYRGRKGIITIMMVEPTEPFLTT